MESIAVTKKYVLKKQNTAAVYKIDYEKDLNPQQLEAVKFQKGSVLVIAGAGSGKTKTLTYRVARLIEDGVSPENILLLTFTKKAADEMLNRAVMILDSRCEKVAGGTFHSFANFILRKYSNYLELRNNFTIIDRADAEDVINHIRAKVIEKQEKRFPRKHTVLDIYSKAVNKNMSAKEKVYLIDNELLDVVQIKRPVDYRTSLAIMKESDWLIHIDANLHGVVNENIFFAAKLADYIGAGKPIFGITMFDGAGADIIREINGVNASYTVDEIKNYLYLITYEGYTTAVNHENADKYNGVNVAAEFDSFIENRVL